MIYCDRQALSHFRGLHPDLDVAITYLETCDVATLPSGKTVVDGETVYINRFNYQTMDMQEEPFETHVNYVDIHLVMSGEEKIDIAALDAQTIIKRDEASDYIGSCGLTECTCCVTTHKALIVFPGEAHRPKQVLNTPCTVEKLVCKVQMRPLIGNRK